MAQVGSPVSQSGQDDSGGRQIARGSRLARRRRVLLTVGIAAALLAGGGLIGASFVKSPAQLAADTTAPAATPTTATVVSQVLTSLVQLRGVVYPSTQYDVYASAPESSASSASSGSSASPASGAGGSAYISGLEVAAGGTIRNGEQLAEIDGETLFVLTGPVPPLASLRANAELYEQGALPERAGARGPVAAHLRAVLPGRRPAARTGSGLGLAIVAATATAHHGNAEAALRQPHGLRVTLTLPWSMPPR